MILFILFLLAEPPNKEPCDTIKSVTMVNDSIIRRNYYVKCDTAKVYKLIDK